MDDEAVVGPDRGPDAGTLGKERLAVNFVLLLILVCMLCPHGLVRDDVVAQGDESYQQQAAGAPGSPGEHRHHGDCGLNADLDGEAFGRRGWDCRAAAEKAPV